MVKKQHQKPQPASKPSIDPLLQQRLLDIFSNAFHHALTSDDFAPLLQEIKQALFNRDFDSAFGREHLDVYAARWSPTRALCYASLFRAIGEHLDEMCEMQDDPGSLISTSTTTTKLRMLSIGGGAAEHMAFAAHLQHMQCNGSLTLVDAAPWDQVTSLLQHRLVSPLPISKYASAAARAANTPLLGEEQLSTKFVQHDILAMDRDQLADLVGSSSSSSKPLLVTLFFTLNELYSTGGIGKTTVFLKTLGEVLPIGSLLLVVDSPGSYSEAAIGKEKKSYPMQWLLNHTLHDTKAGQSLRWRSVESQDSIWFRLQEGLSYPIRLENMRYQMHLYKREDSV